jgi:hypothetical protein
LATLRMRADKFFPGLRVTDAGPLLFTGATLLVLTMKGKPPTLAAISRFCGIPHTSAARHLQVMSRLGWVRREGALFHLQPGAARCARVPGVRQGRDRDAVLGSTKVDRNGRISIRKPNETVQNLFQV